MDDDEVARTAAEYGLTVDEYIQELAEDRIGLLVMRKAIDEFEAENGAFTEEEKAEARAWLAAIRRTHGEERDTFRDAS